MRGNMRIRYRGEGLFLGFNILALLFLLLFGWYYSTHDEPIMAVVFLLIIPVCLASAAMRFSMGLRIGRKWVTVAARNGIHSLRYQDVEEILVEFTPAAIGVRITSKRKPPRTTLWGSFSTGVHWNDKYTIVINPAYVEKSIASLSKCEKVRILNHVTANRPQA